MGLDIGAMSGLKDAPGKICDEDWEIIDEKTGEWEDGKFYVANINPDFKEQAEGLEANKVYGYEEYFNFRAGSYGGYNQWREMLCNMALGLDPNDLWNHKDKYKGEPFYELINFSDCEGTIGSVTCKKLFNDFKKFRARAKGYSNGLPPSYDGEYWFQKYEEWMKAFKMGADNGCVDFH